MCADLQSAAKGCAQIRFRSYRDVVEPALPWPGDFEVILRCIEADQPQIAFIPYLDNCFKDIALCRLGACRVPLSGILFRPMLHYPTFSLHRGKGWPPSLRSWLANYRNGFLACHRRTLSEILTGDPLAPPFYNRILCTSKFRHLPDYVVHLDSYPNPREHFGLPEDRVVLLLLGAIARRKGTLELLKALEQACEKRPGFQTQIALVVAGQIVEAREAILSAISGLTSRHRDVRVMLIHRFVTDREFVTLIAASDVVCIPYIQFVGTASLMIHAAAYGRPVLGPEFGLLGELIRRHNLGTTCDTMNPDALAEGLFATVAMAGRMSEENRAALRTYADGHTLENFGEQICASIVRTARRM